MNTPIKNITDWDKLVKNELSTKSVKTVKNSWYLLCSVLKRHDLTYPEINFPTAVKHEPKYLTTDELKRFVAAAEGDPCELAALLALHSLRRSELAAVTWNDIDLKNNIIKVRGALVYDEHSNIVEKKENKNDTSTRDVPIMIPSLKAALMREEDKTGYVVKYSLNYILRRVNILCKKAGVPCVGTHGLRHTFASLAHHVGLSEQETMEIGGWKDIYTMRKIYQHLERADRLKAENKMKAWYSSLPQ